MYGSTVTYQNFLSNGINQLLALPAVQQATDPVVLAMRDVLTAVQQTTSAVNGTTGAVNTNTSTTYDGGRDTVLSVNTNTSAVNTATAQEQALQSLQNAIAQQNASYQQITNSLLEAIRDLNQTSKDTLQVSRDYLQIMKDQLVVSGIVVQYNSGVSGSYNVSNNMLTALNKIVVNTWATAFNLLRIGANQSGVWATGTLGDGGRIGGRLHTQGGTPIIAELDEFMIKRSSSQSIGYDALEYMNRTGRLPGRAVAVLGAGGANDNDMKALLAEVRELRAEVSRLREENNRGNEAVGGELQAVGDGLKKHNELKAEHNRMLRRA